MVDNVAALLAFTALGKRRLGACVGPRGHSVLQRELDLLPGGGRETLPAGHRRRLVRQLQKIAVQFDSCAETARSTTGGCLSEAALHCSGISAIIRQPVP
jgi:hypothetical protein